MGSNLLIFFVCVCGSCFGVLQNFHQALGPEDFLHYFLKHYSFMFYIQIYDWVWVNFFIRCEVQVKVHIFPCGCSIALTAFVENTIFSILNFSCTSVKTQLTPFVWGYFRILYSVPLAHASIPLIPHWLDYCNCTISLEICLNVSSLYSFCQDSFSYSSSFVSWHKVQINLDDIYKTSCRDFDRNCIKSVYQFGEHLTAWLCPSNLWIQNISPLI